MSYIRLFLMILWSIACISISIIIRLVTFSPSWSVAMARSIWAPGITILAGTKLVFRSSIPLNQIPSPVIVIANHTSVMDIPYLFQVLPQNLYFIGKKELKKVPFIGWYMMAMGMIFIDRTNKEKSIASIQQAADMVKKGKSVVTFPEGTRSPDGALGIFKNGTFHMAIEAKAPILPVFIHGAHTVWPATHFQIKPQTVTVSIGTPIVTEDWTLTDIMHYNRLSREAVSALSPKS
ncbi:MAG: 1-acyl-sn-glycerol-3-phosphate acyltransferase [Cytophagaceae bacterium]|nr:1-acyl-sn-glycerol-3-phosphate acyltransferase [Cytophagaceae bacterium]